MAVPCARFLPDHDVGVVVKGLEELGDGFLAEIGELVLLDFHLGVGIADDVEGNLHGLGGGFKREHLLLLLFGDFEVGEHFGLLLEEDLPALLIEHLARAFVLVERLLVVGNGEVSGGRVGASLLAEPGTVRLIHRLLLDVLLLGRLLLLGVLGIVRLLLDLPRRVLLKNGPDVGLHRYKSYRECVDVQVIEFPGDVVDASEQVQSSVEVVQSMAVPDSRHFSFILQPRELVVTEAEAPKIVEPAFVLPAENVNILAVCCYRSPDSRRRTV